MRRGRLTSLAAVLATGAVAVAGCGGSSSSSSSSSSSGGGGGGGGSTKVASGTAKVDIKNYKYHPASLTVKAGTKVTFTNSDSSEHTATAKNPADQSIFDTDGLNKGDSKSVTFTKPGTYAYICSFHPFMHGTIVVKK